MNAKRLGFRQQKVLAYIAAHPGCTAAEADRATNHYVQDHAHYVTYDAVKRLVRRGIVAAATQGGRNLLTVRADLATLPAGPLHPEARA